MEDELTIDDRCSCGSPLKYLNSFISDKLAARISYFEKIYMRKYKCKCGKQYIAFSDDRYYRLWVHEELNTALLEDWGET
ncbi:hypothetical protein LAV73_06745 [Lysinibacillus xylanilyticus]|uniref:hypothetical protein n=1 Tax=Lysinibacillus xylanilyticus TaxID=582475 RepID=UPI002B24FD46|nr:hypothetical protein [Lysinibacillus xylanilyticus]MEB2279698.1 hypothetical protein [Lysinibacillus xylanilyticus]